jgi:hypothetical protein
MREKSPILNVSSPEEAAARSYGCERALGRVIIQRLIDVLLVHVIREWLSATKDHHVASWIRGLRDPAIARILAILHHRVAAAEMLRETEPVAEVGRRVGYHSEFAFSRARGEPPARYRRAHRNARLRDTDRLL